MFLTYRGYVPDWSGKLTVQCTVYSVSGQCEVMFGFKAGHGTNQLLHTSKNLGHNSTFHIIFTKLTF